MEAVDVQDDTSAGAAEPVDVLILGAGISGIGAAYHLQKQCPWARVVVLDAQASFGGTWLTHRYPGIRSDSDLYTYGYRFKPWMGVPIATAPEILKYMGEVIDENGLAPLIRYHHTIASARWSSRARRWTIEGTRTDTGDPVRFTAGFLWMCQGYYRHSEGYTPDWAGVESFEGRFVHPERWPDDVDYASKTVVVVGSGATAATLVPAMAGACGSLTLLQRSPTFFRTGRNVNELAASLRAIGIDEEWIHATVRRKSLYDAAVFAGRAKSEPETVRRELIDNVQAFLGPDYDMATHFTPRYRPWRQRIAFVPEGDLFKAIASGKASVVTDEIERFTPTGIALTSGRHLAADIVVTATGFNLNVMGDIAFAVDDAPLDWAETVTYRGMMFTGVPNLAWVFGYFRAGWTLRVDLVCDVVCRMLNQMRRDGTAMVEVRLRPEDAGMPILPWADPEGFNPGYLLRGLHLLPKRGDKPEWQHMQDYWADKDAFPAIDLDDPVFVYR
jgi:cation diffusion facilitator CzcD-associated flavoprotein CzcO